jgi:Na+-transporting NADH:ubiquinone oxidoreductase subunit NqrB
MFEEPLEENIQQDLQQEAYERKKVSLKRMTMFVWIADIVLAVYVVTQILDYMNRILNN